MSVASYNTATTMNDTIVVGKGRHASTIIMVLQQKFTALASQLTSTTFSHNEYVQCCAVDAMGSRCCAVDVMGNRSMWMAQ